jgi:hypothetical protein
MDAQLESGRVRLLVSADELMILSNAINETLECLPESELHVRVGAELREIRMLHREIQRAFQLVTK